MSWRNTLTAVFRGCTINDITDPLGIEIGIAVEWATPTRTRTSTVTEYANGELDPGTSARGGIRWKCQRFKTLTQGATGRYQDFGRFLRLETILLGTTEDGSAKYPYVFLKATYRNGADHAAGPLRRSAEHGDTEDGDDTYWLGSTPRLIILDGDHLDLQEGEDADYALTFATKNRGRV
ncbi:MAG: hypothetical protein ABIR47_14580 [Candidatus Kapaibacterium sp.]